MVLDLLALFAVDAEPSVLKAIVLEDAAAEAVAAVVCDLLRGLLGLSTGAEEGHRGGARSACSV